MTAKGVTVQLDAAAGQRARRAVFGRADAAGFDLNFRLNARALEDEPSG